MVALLLIVGTVRGAALALTVTVRAGAGWSLSENAPVRPSTATTAATISPPTTPPNSAGRTGEDLIVSPTVGLWPSAPGKQGGDGRAVDGVRGVGAAG